MGVALLAGYTRGLSDWSPMGSPKTAVNSRVADRLMAEGRITAAIRQTALDRAEASGEPVEEILIELEAIDEPTLLEKLASWYRVDAMSSEELSRAAVDREALSSVPVEIAERHGIYPLELDPDSQRLVVVTADASRSDAVRELRKQSTVSDVRLVVARPAAIAAACARAYRDRPDAFAKLVAGAPAAGDGEGEGGSDGAAKKAPAQDEELFGTDFGAALDGLGKTPPAAKSAGPSPSDGDSGGGATKAAATTPSQQPEGRGERDTKGPSDSITPESDLPSSRSQRSSIALGSRPAPLLLSMLPKAQLPATVTRSAMEQVIAVTRVLTGLLENEREGLRGHSTVVAQLCDDVCYRVGLPKETTWAIVMAALLHDVGKMETGSGARAARPHLTAMNVAQFRAFRSLAAEYVKLPSQLMQPIGLATDTTASLEGMYERFDGRGLPTGIRDSAIPFGARVLAVADTFADLTRNPRNTFDRVLSSSEAMDVLREHAGTVFDPKVVDLVGKASKGEEIASQLLDDRRKILLVDPNLNEVHAVLLGLTDEGVEVHTARTAREAKEQLAAHHYALVMSEIDLDERGAGLTLCEQVTSAEDRTAAPVWVFLSHSRDGGVAKKAFQHGAADIITKPAPPDILVAKLVQLSERRASERPRSSEEAGVRGSLADMTMVDLIQVLHYGQRTGKLRLDWPESSGEIHFSGGQLVHAFVDELQAENAIYRMLAKGPEGRFQVDPTFTPSDEPTIASSADGILLEGMRLLDEGITP